MAFANARNVDARYSTFNDVGRDQYNIHFISHVNEDVGKRTHLSRFKKPLIDIPAVVIIGGNLASLLQPAQMDAYGREECLEGTRIDILSQIMRWATNHTENKNVMWFHGLAGSGKSTISTTLANDLRRTGHLGAYLCFDRNVKEMSDPSVVIRTLAYKLALTNWSLGAEISRVIESNPGIVRAHIHLQFLQLIVEPLLARCFRYIVFPIVVIMAALDECGSPAERRHLVEVLSRDTSRLPFVRFLITSRTDYKIDHAFSSQPHIIVQELDVTSPSTNEDIRTFLRRQMEMIRANNVFLPLPSDWPGDDAIHGLTKRAAGLFLFASTAVAFIDSYNPQMALRKILDEGIYINAQSALDSLYITALDSVGDWNDLEFAGAFRTILGAIVVATNPLSPDTIDSILGLKQMPSSHMIRRLGCVLRWKGTEPVRIIHPSFIDFLSDLQRCGSDRWFIDPELHNRQFALHCVDYLQRVMKYNMCSLTLSAEMVVNATLEPDILYASTFWIEHICAITENAATCSERLEIFVFEHLLHWLEVMSIAKMSRVTIGQLKALLTWINVNAFVSLSSWS